MEEPDKQWRLNAKQLFLTYPKCPLPTEEVLAQLNGSLPISKYVVAEEKHADGESHIHALLILERKINMTDVTKLDLVGIEAEKYHGNYQGARNINAIRKYVMKDGNYITNMETNCTATNSWSQAIEKAKTGNLREAAEHLMEERPRDFILHRTSIINSLRIFQPVLLKSYLPLEGFMTLPTWDKAKSLILTGKTGIGKSSLAKLLLPMALFITHTDGLKNYDETRHEGIIFDDMGFLHLPREAHIHLTDTYDDRMIHCRHTCGFIPRGTPRIFTTNLEPIGILNVADPAVSRRVISWAIKEPKILGGKIRVKEIPIN